MLRSSLFPFAFLGCGFRTRQKVSVNGRSEAAAALFSLVFRLKEQRDKEQQQQQLAQEPRENTSELGSTQMEFLQRLNKKKKSVCVRDLALNCVCV